jgi:thiol-disulfide isomerase/thioredoxin
MPIWAEWCAPCLSEFPDFARLQQKYGNSKFAIIPVLSATQKQFTNDVLTEMFSLMHASVFEPLQESMHGSSLARTMGRRGTGYALPCNLLIGPDGRAVAREIGMEPKNKPAGDDTHSSKPGNYRAETLNKVQAGESLSLWGEVPGDEFVAALANGFLG